MTCIIFPAFAHEILQRGRLDQWKETCWRCEAGRINYLWKKYLVWMALARETMKTKLFHLLKHYVNSNSLVLEVSVCCYGNWSIGFFCRASRIPWRSQSLGISRSEAKCDQVNSFISCCSALNHSTYLC